MIKESDIVYEAGIFWVLKTRDAYTVLKIGVMSSYPDSSYAPTPDGLSIAIARCDYLSKRELSK